MANGSNLNFSVIFSAVTQAFNAGVKGAAKTYQDATNDIKGSSDQIDDAADKAGTALYGLLNIKPSGQLKAEIAAISAQLANFQRNSGAPAAEIKRVTAEAQAQLSALRAQATGTSPAFTQMAATIRGIGPAAAAITGVTLGLAGVKQGVEEVIAATLRYQAIMKQLEFATGSTEAAKREYEFLVDVVKRLGLDLNASAEGFAKLAGATRGTSLEGEGTRKVFEGVAAAAATMNLTGAETNGMFVALSQMMGKGKVTAEEWRGQFAERMPAAAAVMQKALKMSATEFNAFIESGADASEFLAKLGPAFIEAFGPGAAQNAASLRGQINGLKNEFELLLVKVGEGGVGGAAIAIMSDLRRAIEMVSGAMDSIDPSAAAAANEIFKQLYDMVKNVFSTLMTGVSGAASALNDLLDGVLGVVTGFVGVEESAEKVGLLTRAVQGLSILLGVFNDGIKGVEIALELALGVAQSFFSAVAFGLSVITFGDLSRELEQFSFELQNSAQKAFDSASEKAMSFQSAAVAAADAAVAAHTESAAGVKRAHTDAAAGVVDAQGKVADSAKTAAEVIKLSAVDGAKATVTIAAANQEVIKAMQDLAKESGIALPVVKMSAEELAQTMGEVAAKSSTAAEAIGKNLAEAIAKLDAKNLTVMWDGYLKGLEEANASTELLAKTNETFATAAVKLLGGDITAALGKMSEGFADNVAMLDRLSEGFDVMKKMGIDASVAIGSAMDGMLAKAKNPTELNELIRRWEDLGKQGKVTGQQMSEGLEQARKKLDEVRPGVNSVNEALRTLGITANDTAANMQAKYAEAFRVLKESGQATFTQLTQGLKAMFAAANDMKSLQALTAQFKELGAQGKIASYDVKQGLADIQNKMDEMKPGINSLAEAFKTFGMTTREEAAALADRYGQAFTVMRNSGQATAAELRQAFTAYAQAAVQANGGLVDGFVQAQAASLGLRVSVDETGKVIVEAMSSGASATDAMGMSLERAIDSYGRLGSAAQAAAEKALAAKEKELEMTERLMDAKQKEIDLENRRLGRDREGFSVDASGKRIEATIATWMSTLAQLKSWGLDEEQARKLANEAFDDNGKQQSLSNYRRNRSEDWNSVLRNAAEEMLRQTPLNNQSSGNRGAGGNASGGSGTQSTSTSSGRSSGSGVSSPNGKTTTVILNEGRNRVRADVPTADEARFLAMLGNARRAA